MACTNRWSVVVLVLAGVGLGAGAPDARLPDAAEKHDSRAVVALLKQGADPNVAQPDGATALHWAAHWNDFDSARALLAKHANVHAANDYGVTPIFLAATNGSSEMLSVLLEAGAAPNAALPTGETALMTAVRSGAVAAVKRLLAAGADPNATQLSKGQTALMWAVSSGRNADVVKALIERGADVNGRSKSGFTALLFAARDGNIELTRQLLAAGADINASAGDGSTALFVATARASVDLALLLLDRGAKADGDFPKAGTTPLHWAASRTESGLTYKGVEPPGDWQAVSGISDRNAKFTLIKALVAHGANIEARSTKSMPSVLVFTERAHVGGTPFFAAASSGDLDVMRMLLALGADPTVRDGQGSTALLGASGGIPPMNPRQQDSLVIPESDRLESVKFLVSIGNQMEGENKEGYRAMHMAAGSGFHSIIQFLVDQGADVNPLSKGSPGGGFSMKVSPKTPTGIADGINAGALFIRPETAAFLRTLGGKSIGSDNLDNYKEQFKKDQQKPAAR